MSSCNPGAGGAVGTFRRRPRPDDRGAGVVEYELLLTLLTLVSLVALTFMGGSVRGVFVAITERIFAA